MIDLDILPFVPSQLSVNPHAVLSFVRDDSGVTGVKIQAPVRGAGLQVGTFERATDPGLFTFLLIYSAAPDTATALDSLSADEQTKLVNAGFLITPEQTSSPVLYENDLIDPPLALLPERARAAAPPAPTTAELAVDPTLHVIGDGGPPASMRGRFTLANPFRTDRSWIGVDGDVAVPNFYSCTPELGAQISSIAAGTPATKIVDPSTRTALRRAGVLRSPDEIAARTASRQAGIARAHAQLTGDRWVVLKEVIRPEQIAALRDYYRALIAEGHVRYADAEWPNRYFASRDPLTYFFQQQLAGVISDIAGEPVKPSFSFFTSYRPGADLPPHKDREQCYLAMSVLLDHGDASDLSPWPIYVQPPGAAEGTAVHQGLGDGLLYYGEEVLHWRHALTQGYSTLWFLFWVPEHFDQPLD